MNELMVNYQSKFPEVIKMIFTYDYLTITYKMEMFEMKIYFRFWKVNPKI